MRWSAVCNLCSLVCPLLSERREPAPHSGPQRAASAEAGEAGR